MPKGLNEFSDECKAFFGGGVGEHNEFMHMKAAYTANMYNTGYMVANILKWGSVWAFFVWIGQEEWRHKKLSSNHWRSKPKSFIEL